MAEPFDGFYRGRRVFLTGHTGFKGAWLAAWLLDLGAEVAGYALAPSTKPALFDRLGLSRRMAHTRGDVTYAPRLARALKAHRPEIVFHLAAQALVRPSYADPVGTYRTNVLGTVNLFEAARAARSVKAVVNVTSDKCYENREWVYGYREMDPMGGHDPYSASKGCAELVTSSYRNSFFAPAGLGLASGRAGNVIGGGDWSVDRLIPDCVRALTCGRVIDLRNPGATRPWQHVLEPLSGYLQLGALLRRDPSRYAAGWNFGPDDDSVLTVEQVVQRIVGFWGDGRYRVLKTPQPHEAKLLKLDASLARQRLGWRPVWDIDTALSMTVSWYRAHADGRMPLSRLTSDQIRAYTERAGERGLAWAA
jgi:CDP-glucose 4,6-dehydratase